MKDVAIIASGGANIASLSFALERLGCAPEHTADPARIHAASHVILPGVGAAADAMRRLNEHGLVGVIPTLRQPVLGICLGMQLLFETSEEGTGAGLEILPGRVRKLRATRLPHMGWNEVAMGDDPLFAGIPKLIAYYANSYVAEPAAESEVIGWTEYQGERFPAAVRSGRVWGVQFHPEKSGAAGLRLLGNFLAQVGR